MTDTDWLGFEDPVERRAAQGPALVIPATLGPAELLVLEQMHRMGDDPACNRVLFVDTDEASGEEIWAPPAKGDRIDEGERWKAIMRWPVIPDIRDAEAFKANALAARLAKWWDRLKAARAEDEAERPVAPETTRQK
ncbi:hypothetical protein [Bradyrhizobium sp. 27S5]|uniref:hypothetical protein n=1 Tax=Bradyrhizobium sp. 27S5 TaxID=3139728 RepID=UPI0030CEB605